MVIIIVTGCEDQWKRIYKNLCEQNAIVVGIDKKVILKTNYFILFNVI